MKDGRIQASIERGASDGFDHRSYTFSPDGRSIISGGSSGALMSYDLTGKLIGKFIGHEGDVWAVTPSPDGRLLISGSADQTVRLWNLQTRELIVTLFQGTDGEWVMWTPQGYYTGSPGADKIVGWQVNKGPAQAADYVGAEQLRQHLNRPDIVEKAIILASAEQAVREAPGTTFQLADLLARPVPRFRIASPQTGTTQRGGRIGVRIAIEATPDPIKSIRVQVNGLQVDEETAAIGSGGIKPGERVLDVPLAKGRNEVRIVLTNAIGEKAETLGLMHEGDGALDKRGTLYLIAIGVDKYPGLGKTCGTDGNASCDLNYSGADARALVAAVEKRLGPAHTNVVKRLLVNGGGAGDSPTASNILDAIDLLKDARETDTVVLFIAGHGYNEGSNYKFLATNAEWVGANLRGSTVVQWQVLQAAVESAKGRRILLIDTCHAGNAYNQTLGNAAYHANIIAYTAARFDQEAIEDPSAGPRAVHASGGGRPRRQGRAGREAPDLDQGARPVRRQARRPDGQGAQGRAGAAILQGPRRRRLRAGALVKCWARPMPRVVDSPQWCRKGPAWLGSIAGRRPPCRIRTNRCALWRSPSRSPARHRWPRPHRPSRLRRLRPRRLRRSQDPNRRRYGVWPCWFIARPA